MIKNITSVIIIILLIGILYRLFLTANGNFIFNMDNARDMVDVREMVVLGKPRLIGPTSAIEGFFNGPAWYYLLAIPFMLSGGDPYASILMEIVLWTIGGFFLLKLVSRWGVWVVLPVGAIWVASNYIVLTNLYAFNPNPVTLLSPLFLYLLVKYLEKGNAFYGIFAWFLGGLFFNFEMNFGVFIPVIIITSVIVTKNIRLLRQKWFWIGVAVFVSTLLPQIIFDLKHQFLMSKAVLRYLLESSGGMINIPARLQTISGSFYNAFLPTLMNQRFLSLALLGFLIPLIYGFFKKSKKEAPVLVSLVFIFIPFLGYLILPVTVNTWHLGGEMVASLVLIANLIKKLMEGKILSKITAVLLSISIVWFGLANINYFFTEEFEKPNLDPSLYKNEIAAIDFVYKYANGQNFKAYAYLPSVIDYPYQYLFWWHGLKEFGYLPVDYAYAPNKPPYISNKKIFSGGESLEQRKDSKLVFLIKEPNRDYTRFGWEGDFIKLESIIKQILGSLEVEVRREVD